MHHIRLTVEKISARLKLIEKKVYYNSKTIEPFRVHFGNERLINRMVNDKNWPTIKPGDYWGELRKDFTLRTHFTVPNNWKQPVALYLPLGNSKSLEALSFLYGPEALVYLDGKSYIGLDPHRPEIILPEELLDGKEHTIALYGWTGIKDERYEMGQPCLVQINQNVRDFIYRSQTALEVAHILPDNNPSKAYLLNTLDAAFLLLDLREPLDEEFYKSIEQAQEALQQGVSKSGSSLDVNVAACGHGHLDLAWLWTLSQTREKGARTFSNVLRLMERFPEFRFTQSQPQLYQFISQDHPEIFSQIKERVREGRWETIGGMWVEADCNISGSESLARQFLLGRNYYLEQFGKPDSPVLWLPDVFGFPWQLPQLMKEAGISYFATAKLSWNQYNRMPYDSFWWQGLDGTKILTYLITTSKPGWWGATYSAELTTQEIMTTWDKLQQKEYIEEILIPFGYGDGGGGPTSEMLEKSYIMAEHPCLPKVNNSTVKGFFERLENKSGGNLPVWNNELYFELHRGTYTNQAQIKLKNRKSEFLLHNVEFLAAWAYVNGEFDYPHSKFKRAWQLLCLNQFHDIIPGSSIGEVYQDSMKDYDEIWNICEEILKNALYNLDATMPQGTELVIYNPISFTQSKVIEITDKRFDQKQMVTLKGEVLPMQHTEKGTLVLVPDVPAYGYLALRTETGQSEFDNHSIYAGTVDKAPYNLGTLQESFMVLENSVLRVELEKSGDLVRIYDKKNNREVLPQGEKANLWQAYEDRPLDWDAWDIDIFYDEKQWLAEPAENMKVLELGPLRACLEIRRNILNSTIVQHIFLELDSARLDFKTWIKWKEQHSLLKVSFPVNIMSPTATYEIQWGNIERPTHRNTSWDWARFESCAHKWVDLSEGDYGISLLNDCKYGHNILDNIIYLTVLRGSTFPDPSADQGEHVMNYSLFIHESDWRNGTVSEAYSVNNPMIVHPIQNHSKGKQGKDRKSLINVNNKQVIIETIKLAEDGNGLIARMYEHERTRGIVELDVGFEVNKAFSCNLLEENNNELKINQSKVVYHTQPYEIKTIRLT